GELAPLEVEGVAVGVVRRAAENRDPAVVLRPAELPVVGNVAPHEIPPLTAPGRSLRPERPRPQTQDRCVSLPEAVERGIDGDDVRIDVRGRRGAAAEIAGGAWSPCWTAWRARGGAPGVGPLEVPLL